jgi:hypothetical protein
MDKQQFNVYLPPELVRRVKMRSLELDESLSAFVETALTARLEPPADALGSDRAIEALPIVYVTDMDASIAFYRALGFAPRSIGPTWSVLAGGGTQLALTAPRSAHRGRGRLSSLHPPTRRWKPSRRALKPTSSRSCGALQMRLSAGR